MNWQKVGDYGMKCGEYRVGKFRYTDKFIYVLCYGWERLMQSDNFRACAAAAEAHRAAA